MENPIPYSYTIDYSPDILDHRAISCPGAPCHGLDCCWMCGVQTVGYFVVVFPFGREVGLCFEGLAYYRGYGSFLRFLTAM